ncbi:MAG: cytochrome C [Elusimicrobia bacterium]|nr:cytochrome C [Elusimicrobiota bacterium]
MLTRSTRTGGTAAVAAAVLLAVLGGTARASTADHRQFAALKKKFADGPAVTRACLGCHTKAGEEIHATSHWNWLGEEVEVPGRAGKHRLGKANLLNNFCVGVRSNEASCAKCHIGFGWKDKTFDFKSQANIDCIACHDGTGEYVKKAPGAAPDAGSAAEWTALALGVGPTSVRTCGACHFAGGGGEGVKHGDLDPSLLEAKKTLDVHMASDGVGFTCASCHRGEESGHRFKGRAPSVSVDSKNMVTCAQCHGDGPHGRDFASRSEKEREAAGRFTAGPQKLAPWQSLRRNWHARRVACQTCHIPTFARENSTKLSWDWSKAGRRDPDGRPVTEYDDDGNISYLGIKGAFKWGKNVVPAYRWWNGTSGRYLTGDAFDPSRTLVMNPPLGGAGDGASKIWPFKLHEGNQPYDVVHKTLIQPKTYGPKGSGAYWSDYDWEKASRLGMKYAGLPFSGKVGFARTEMYWPVSHMVTQGDKGLSCADCHSRASRLAGVGGVYMPGYDRSAVLDFLGWSSALLSLLGVLGHGFLRWLAGRGQFERLLAWLSGWRKR